MSENQEELFHREDYLKKSSKADYVFFYLYTKMTDEIERVANEEVTIWSRLVSWIYWKVFKNPSHTKIKQDDADKYRSAKAFHRVKTVFEPVKSESMDNGQIMEHTQRNY